MSPPQFGHCRGNSFPTRARHEDAVGDASVEMGVAAESRAEAVEDGDGTESRASRVGLSPAWGEPAAVRVAAAERIDRRPATTDHRRGLPVNP